MHIAWLWTADQAIPSIMSSVWLQLECFLLVYVELCLIRETRPLLLEPWFLLWLPSPTPVVGSSCVVGTDPVLQPDHEALA